MVVIDRSRAVRVWAVRTNEEGLGRLRRLVELWPCIVAAQQSNLVRDAEAAQNHGRGYYCHSTRVSIPVTRPMAETDADRLANMFKMWPNLDRRKQAELVEYAELVS